MPSVSVILPAYNAAASIGDSIAAALGQGLRDFELIVVDDGSTDATPEILRGLSDPRLKVLTQPNRGSYPARNAGIRAASGEFIAFLDADDLWTSDKLESQLTALRGQPQAGVAYS